MMSKNEISFYSHIGKINHPHWTIRKEDVWCSNSLGRMGLGGSKSGQLNNDEISRIKNSWKTVMENPEENGIFIFKTFLDKHNYYSKFPKFSNVPISELHNNKIFRKHATSIIQAINNVILHLENDLLLKNDLNALGKMHRKRNVSEEQFQELKTVILDILEKEFQLPHESIKAWIKTLDIAFEYIFEGLQEQH